MRIFSLLFLLSCSHLVPAQVTTSDLPRWYALIDALPTAQTHADSLALVERLYLSQASPGLKLFAKARLVTAENVVYVLGAFPNYYASIRADALRIDEQRDSITATLQRVAQVLPEFEVPPVTIAFGVMNSGGTAVGNHILLGAGMNLGRATSDTTELTPWHRAHIIPAPGLAPDLRAMVAHEAIHTRQRRQWGWAGLSQQVLFEGVCDFVVYDLLGFTATLPQHRYGAAHECAVWQDFEADRTGPKPRQQLLRWLYGGNTTEVGRPADLGYFVGRRMAAAYYAQAEDKNKALRTLMRPGQYEQVRRKSGYVGGCGHE